MSDRQRRIRLDLPKIKMHVPATTENKHSELTDSVDIDIKNEEKCSRYLIKYHELEEIANLGSGSFGVVKKMVHVPTNLVFAVKCIRVNLVDNSDNRDIEVALRLGDRCANLVRFYGALVANDHYMILTEPMDVSLDRFYEKAFELRLRLPEPFLAHISQSVLNALQYMKNSRLMHRDIKPSNILLNNEGEIKVCDYGICGFLNSESLCKSIKGCQKYMSPEKFHTQAAKKGYSIKADIWSLGISMIEIATGIHPYWNIKVFFDLAGNIVEKEPPKLDTTKFSDEFCSFVDNCLTKDEKNRPNVSQMMQHNFILDNERKDMNKIRTVIHVICNAIVSQDIEKEH